GAGRLSRRLWHRAARPTRAARYPAGRARRRHGPLPWPAPRSDAHAAARPRPCVRRGPLRTRPRVRGPGLRHPAVGRGRGPSRPGLVAHAMTVVSAALLLFLILDPLGNIPVFLGVLRHLPPERQRVVLARELLIALAVLMAFLWGGKYALELMHLRQESVSIAGGIVLFLIGMRMIFPPPEGLMGELPGGEPFIVPMAIPRVAGPSGMAVELLMGSQEPDRRGSWSRALLVAWAATAAILFSATYLYRWLGGRVLTAIERLMGMVIVAISVQMFLDGLSAYLQLAGS